jgi:hypothetical protein
MAGFSWLINEVLVQGTFSLYDKKSFAFMKHKSSTRCSEKSATTPQNLRRDNYLHMQQEYMPGDFFLFFIFSRCATALSKQRVIIPSVPS